MKDQGPTQEPSQRQRAASWTGGVLAVFVVGFVLQVGKSVLLPIVIAFLFSLLFRAPILWLADRRFPRPVGAGLALLTLGGLLGLGLAQLTEPASRWLQRAPTSLQRLEHKLQAVRGSVDEVSRAAEKVQEMTEIDQPPGTTRVQVEERSATSLVFDHLRELVSTTVIVFVLLYLLLVYGEGLLDQLIQLLPGARELGRSQTIATTIERDVSRYLLTITAINGSLALAVTGVTAWVGLPSPWLWGTMAGLLNFVPFLGGLIGVTIVGAVALTSVEPAGHALLAPLAYGLLTALEGMLITPVIVGRRFSLNPVIVFVWLLLWGWLWQVAGMLVAIPLLTVIKVLADEIPDWSRTADLLARPSRRPPSRQR